MVLYQFVIHTFTSSTTPFNHYSFGQSITGTQKHALFTALSLIVVIFCGVINHVLWIVVLGSCVTILHAAFYTPLDPLADTDGLGVPRELSAWGEDEEANNMP